MRATRQCLYARPARRCPALRAAGMFASSSEPSHRLNQCRRCGVQVQICRRCDRGNVYCTTGCAPAARRESLLRAGARYQRSYRGACHHAARQRAWRDRQEVTHQGSPAAGTAATVRAPGAGPEARDARPHSTVDRSSTVPSRASAASSSCTSTPSDTCAEAWLPPTSSGHGTLLPASRASAILHQAICIRFDNPQRNLADR